MYYEWCIFHCQLGQNLLLIKKQRINLQNLPRGWAARESCGNFLKPAQNFLLCYFTLHSTTKKLLDGQLLTVNVFEK